MASSGVWENIILTKTPTFEGVCGMLYFIIFLNFCQKFRFLLTDGKSTFLLTDGRSIFISIFMTDCHNVVIPLMLLADVNAMWFYGPLLVPL